MFQLIAGLAGSIFSGMAQKKAAGKAAAAQTSASNAQIAETRRQFDLVQGLLKPYVTAGSTGLQAQLDLMGLGGGANMSSGPNGVGVGGISAQDAQRNAISGLANGSQFQALVGQGEEALLANASATGGLRGGDTQGALAQFRPQMLQQLIDRQLAQYGGLAANGQNAAGQTGTAAMNAGGMVNASLGNIGQAQAGAALARGQANQNMMGGMMKSLGQFGESAQGQKFFGSWGGF